jgi:hypothetical protein
MQMTEAFASAVTVSVPIFVLAAGAEARGIRERLRRPDERWERDFAAYRSERELDLSGHPSDIFAYLKGVPGLSKLYVVERIMAIGSALIWLAVFVLLGIAELRCLVWLADGDPAGNSGLAAFSVVVIAVAMAALIVAPTLYFLIPLVLPLDVIPQGLKDAVGPKLGDQRARGFIKLALQEFEGAMERADEKLEAAAHQEAPPAPPAAPARPPDPDPGEPVGSP